MKIKTTFIDIHGHAYRAGCPPADGHTIILLTGGHDDKGRGV